MVDRALNQIDHKIKIVLPEIQVLSCEIVQKPLASQNPVNVDGYLFTCDFLRIRISCLKMRGINTA